MTLFETRYARVHDAAPTEPSPTMDAGAAASSAATAEQPTGFTLPEVFPKRIRKPRKRLIDQVPRKFSRNAISAFVGLIKTIPADLHPRIERYIVRVFNGTADREGLIRYLHERCGVSEARARMIADDQIAKASERMRVEKWRSHGKDYVQWIHSGAGEPREYHMMDWDGVSGADGRPNGLNGFVFELSNPPVIDLTTGERGYPAQLVNCHCYLKPITAKEFESMSWAMAAKAEQEYLDTVLAERGMPPQVLVQPPAA